MRAGALVDGRIVAMEVTEPEAGAGQVLIDVQSCGICGSDLSLTKDAQRFVDVAMDGGYDLAVFDTARPVVPGHEFAGTVAALGPGVSGLSVGDRVTGVGIATDPVTSETTIIGYSNEYPGGFGQRIVVDVPWVRPIPESLDFDAASLAEPLHVGETHVQQSDYRTGDTALVIGCGTIGLGVVIALAARGCDSIVVVEPSPARRRLAERLGAHVAVAPPDGGPAGALPESAERVVAYECSGRQGALDQLIRTLPLGSAVQVVASPFQPETIVPVIAQWRQIVVNFGGGAVDDPYGVTLARLADGTIDPGLFVTGHVDIEGLADAVVALRDPEEHVKILVHPNGRRP